MSYSVFKNVKTVSVAGKAITCPTSVTVEWEDNFIQDSCDGSFFPTKTTYGARVRSVTVNARDPITLFSAVGQEGACSFVLQDGEGGSDTTFTLGTGRGASFSFGSGDTGELGSGSITAMLKGATS